MSAPKKGDTLISREGKKRGVVRGPGRPCTMESCGGQKVSVRWSDGELTYCCERGMALTKPRIWKLT